MNLIKYNNIYPKIETSAFIAPNATIIGDVTIGARSGIWFGVIIRGDVAKITIGNQTNIQDGAIVHVTRGGGNTIIGNNITIGHKALIHACHLQDHSFIGMGAIIMDQVIVNSYAMVAAGSVVTPGKTISQGEIWAGNPAKFLRNLTSDETKFIDISAQNYAKHADEYKIILA